MPKILYIDIETSPNIADVWGLWNQNISLKQLKQSARIIGFAAKWRGQKRSTWYGENTHTHKEIILQAHKLCDQANLIVTYNGDKFDHKHLNAEWVSLELPPPSPSKSLDLYKIVKKNFKFPSNKLQYVCTRLLGEGKLSHTGHELWTQCLDPEIDQATKDKAWKLMARYCKQDVNLLEPLHDKLTPWLPNSVGMALFDRAGLACQKCGSTDLQSRGTAYTATRAYPQYRCNQCGGWTRSTQISWSSNSQSSIL